MAVVCPTVTAEEPHQYREQINLVAPFAGRIHIDLADGKFAPRKLINAVQVWWPTGMVADIHVMYEQPLLELETLVSLKPHLVIVHAEADGGFYDFANKLHELDIKAGVALLQDTPVDVLEPAMKIVDHVLVFSGDLGHFGGTVNPALMSKVKALRAMKPELEIGWDGGVNVATAKALQRSGVDVLNTGGFIHNADDPQAAYDTLVSAIQA